MCWEHVQHDLVSTTTGIILLVFPFVRSKIQCQSVLPEPKISLLRAPCSVLLAPCSLLRAPCYVLLLRARSLSMQGRRRDADLTPTPMAAKMISHAPVQAFLKPFAVLGHVSVGCDHVRVLMDIHEMNLRDTSRLAGYLRRDLHYPIPCTRAWNPFA